MKLNLYGMLLLTGLCVASCGKSVKTDVEVLSSEELKDNVITRDELERLGQQGILLIIAGLAEDTALLEHGKLEMLHDYVRKVRMQDAEKSCFPLDSMSGIVDKLNENAISIFYDQLVQNYEEERKEVCFCMEDIVKIERKKIRSQILLDYPADKTWSLLKLYDKVVAQVLSDWIELQMDKKVIRMK